MSKAEAILLPSDARVATVPIQPVAKAAWPAAKQALALPEQAWVEAHGFEAAAGQHLIVADGMGGIAKVLFGVGEVDGVREPFVFGRLARLLPRGVYRIDGILPEARLAVLGWLLEAYSFDRYRKRVGEPARLLAPAEVDRAGILRAAAATTLVRDLINTPASAMGPAELAKAARRVAAPHKAKFAMTAGQGLKRGFPMIQAVGQASPRAPRLIDFTWGLKRNPKVTLVGKGVCFDTGGLDIKPAAGMLLMKKDMGGAATVLGLAQMVMTAGLPVRLRVLIPAVENAIAGNAFRPGDVLESRKGLTVEVGNTDAEGRLILADALALGDEETPDLLVDLATLTGAARVALGPDLPPFYTDDEELALCLARHAEAENDPLWRMPLWRPYLAMMEGRVADLNNASESGFAGSLTAALFLKRFVAKAKAYLHVDIFGWTPVAKPGRPKGGEAQAMRALFALIAERFG